VNIADFALSMGIAVTHIDIESGTVTTTVHPSIQPTPTPEEAPA